MTARGSQSVSLLFIFFNLLHKAEELSLLTQWILLSDILVGNAYLFKSPDYKRMSHKIPFQIIYMARSRRRNLHPPVFNFQL